MRDGSSPGRNVNGRWQELLELWHQPRIEQVFANNLIRACQRADEWRHALAVFGEMPARRAVPDRITFVSATAACANQSLWGVALSLFHDMLDSKVTPDVVNYNSLIKVCQTCGRWQLAAHLLYSMPSPDHISFATTIGACEKGRAWEHALAVLFGMPEEVLPSGIACGAAVNACKTGGHWEQVLALLEALQAMQATPDEISYNAAIVACKHNWQMALGMFERMRVQDIRPDVVSYGSALHSCGACGRWEQALCLFHSFRSSGLQANEVLYSSLISACGGQWQAAMAIVQLMCSDHIRPDVFVYGAAISSCEQDGCWTEALHLMDRMVEIQVAPNLICCNAAISACDKGGQWQWALALFSSLPSLSIRRDTITFSAAISAFQECHEWGAALHLLSTMTKKGIAPNEITYTTAISALEKACRWHEALEMTHRMAELRLQPTLATYGAAMSACDSAAAWGSALRLLEDMRSSRMILLFSVDNSVTILTGTVAGILLDRYGPASISLAGGLLQACGLLLMGLAGGPDEPALVDGFLLAFVISAVGGTCLMLQSLKLAFIVAPKHFALIMTLSNCLVDSSSVIPLGLYRFHVAGMSRAGIFTGYALLCLVSSAFLAFSWCGRPGRRLHRTNMEELQSAKPGACAEHPRLHGLTLKQQLSTFEFAVAVTFMMTQVFRPSFLIWPCAEVSKMLNGDLMLMNWFMLILCVFDDADLRLISDDLFASDDLFVSDDEDKSLVHVPEEVSRKEQELITRQLAHIDARIRRGGTQQLKSKARRKL
ncbi:unnamed protein product [Effrenium voratum]|nr:unnamed protein product [Effrenium voratum]